jgi:hypothetical protein
MAKRIGLWCIRVILAAGATMAGMLLIVLSRNVIVEWWFWWSAFFISVLTIWGASSIFGMSDDMLYRSKEKKN